MKAEISFTKVHAKHETSKQDPARIWVEKGLDPMNSGADERYHPRGSDMMEYFPTITPFGVKKQNEKRRCE